MPRHSLNDPDYRRFAWRRYRRILRWMALVAILLVAVALIAIYASWDDVSIHLAIAVALGTFFTVMMAGALMGLMFLSSGSGHDQTIADPFKDDTP
jgi:uncharacterized membrane protein